MAIAAFVYILASKKRGTLYTGVTSNLERRLYQHRNHFFKGFTSKYSVTRLVWFSQGDDIAGAIELEKKIKNRNRQWKIDLIERENPDWNDLAANWLDSATADAGASFAQNGGPGESWEGLQACRSARSEASCCVNASAIHSIDADGGKEHTCSTWYPFLD